MGRARPRPRRRGRARTAGRAAGNIDDATLDILRHLDRRRGATQVLAAAEVEQLRREIQRFTVRRTKSLLNDLVDREPDAYVHPDTGRDCRYPQHDPSTYPTGETTADEAVAEEIRSVARKLVGIAQLERTIAVPAALRGEYTDERWLELRLSSARGLAAHHVLGAMRSSRAALVEHLAGTAAASERFGISRFKAAPTGDVLGKLDRLVGEAPPEVALACDVPAWLVDADGWVDACRAERDRYAAMLEAAGRLSAARERAKAELLAGLLAGHDRVLAFDRHPITLEQLRGALRGVAPADVEVVVAAGAGKAERRRVEELFERTSAARAVALCSDAMNEGLNLQGASAIVHLDLPTTLRVAEQRVGRVDRMDSPHATIEAHWPKDGPAFATRANELLAQRAAESEQLLGANLRVPSLSSSARAAPGAADEAIVDVAARISEAESPAAETWDGIRDALDPARSLVSGSDPLVAPALYDALRHEGGARVVSAVAADEPWAFLAVTAGSGHGAPRWLFLDGPALRPVVGLDEVARHLRRRLADDPPGARLAEGLPGLDRALVAAARAEHLLLPRRMQRALDQLVRTSRGYADDARRRGDEAAGARWTAVAGLADPAHVGRRPDPYAVAEGWLELVRPRLDAARGRRRHQQFVLLREIDADLGDEPLGLDEVERAFGDLPVMPPLDERVAACILGVVGSAQGPAREWPTGRKGASR